MIPTAETSSDSGPGAQAERYDAILIGSGQAANPLAVNQVKVRQRKREIVESFRSGSEDSLRRDGIEGGELMAVLEAAMLGRLPYTVLRDAVFAHPTLAESLNNLFYTFQE